MKATEVELGLELVVKRVALFLHHVGYEPDSGQQVGCCCQFYRSFAIALNHGEILADTLDEFIAFQRNGVDDSLQVERLGVGIDDAQTDFKGWNHAFGRLSLEGTERDGGFFVIRAERRACTHQQREGQGKD